MTTTNDEGIIKAAECPECGRERCLVVRVDYTLATSCPDCGFESLDYFEDLYGNMSVPWGFLL